ncbi:MAG: hypothetical protein PHP00_06155 [Thiotrichaceae bacterium]|nr:hypothetical protein [Thiotrichaceae bacterium]
MSFELFLVPKLSLGARVKTRTAALQWAQCIAVCMGLGEAVGIEE